MANQQVSAVQENLQNRLLLLQTGQKMNKYLQPITLAPNQTGRVNLLNTGITTNLRVELTFQSSSIASAFLTPIKPGSLFTTKFVDYSTNVRFNIRDIDVYLINMFRKGKDGFLINFDYSPSSGVYENQFVFDLPLAVHKDSDLTGALMTNVSGGTAYVEFTNTSSNTLSFQVVQEFLAPQYVGGSLPLPIIDLNTVHELTYVVSTDNLLPNNYKYIDLPQNRKVLNTFLWYYDGTNLESLKTELIVNGNTTLYAYDELTSLIEMDRHLSQDITQTQLYTSKAFNGVLNSSGYYAYMCLRYFDFSENPLITNNYGAVQFRFSPAVVGTGAFVNTTYVNLYTIGQVGSVQQ